MEGERNKITCGLFAAWETTPWYRAVLSAVPTKKKIRIKHIHRPSLKNIHYNIQLTAHKRIKINQVLGDGKAITGRFHYNRMTLLFCSSQHRNGLDHDSAQQHPRPCLWFDPLTRNTSSHSLIPFIQGFVPYAFLFRLLCSWALLSSIVIPLRTLPPSLAPKAHWPPSPYCIPLCGSSGSISPSSIFVRMIRASRLNNSSTFCPDKAETSTATGIFDFVAQSNASLALTSRSRGAIVAVILVPMLGPVVERTEPPPESHGKDDCLLEVLKGVRGGLWILSRELPSRTGSSIKSVLFPAKITVRLGDAKARASMRNVGRAVKEV